jgi:uncharacterized protein YndB with AHSA1/START domain
MEQDRIEKKMLLRAPLERVWRALADSAEFGTWFGLKVDAPFTPGAVIHAVLTPTQIDAEVGAAQKSHEGTAFVIMVETMEPQRRFSFRWHPHAIEPGADYSAEPTTLVSFTLEQTEDGILLTVTESGFENIPVERRAKAFEANEQGWGMMVRVFGKYVEHAP